MFPNFIIGGATAAGTSFLGHLLLQHPDIFMPKEIDAEPHFFSLPGRYAKGIEWYQKTWFEGYESQKTIGERSSTYLHFPDTASRLKKHIPEVKLIFLVRNPVDRAWAHYRYMVLRGIEELDFETALTLEKSRAEEQMKKGIETQHHDYAGRSMYGQQIEPFLKVFTIDQILFVNSEKLRQETELQLKRVTDFLGIQPLHSFKINSDFASVSVKDPNLQAKARQHFGFKKSRSIIEAIRNKEQDLSCFIQTELDAYYITGIKKNLCETKEELSLYLKEFLQSYFKQDQRNFFKLLNNHLDFQPWY